MLISTAIEQFATTQSARNLSPNTIRAQATALSNLLAWSRSNNLGMVDELTADALAKFSVWMQQDCGLAASTVTTRLKFVRGFMSWLETEGETGTVKITMPRQPPHGLPDVLSDHEISLVIERIAGWTDGPRAKYRVMILTMLATGLRIHETLKLRVGEMDVQGGQATICGKGGRVRTIAWAPKGLAGKQISKWCKGRDGTELMFPGPGGDELSQDAVQAILRELGAEIDTELSAHKLRRTWCSQSIAAGVPPHVVQKLGGWSDLSIVSRYLQLADYQAVHLAQRMARI